MTDQEINIAIAEACPSLFRVAKMSKDIIWIDPDGYDQDASSVHDLNAQRAIWLTLDDGNVRVQYSMELGAIVARDMHLEIEDGRLAIEGIVENATARQRAEAFLRTIGKWKN